jgi:hypothetical protein
LRFTWTQISGRPVTLSGANTATPTFLAPQQASRGQETLTFRLAVDDGFDGRASDDVVVTVLAMNAPPVCSLAQASPALLEPPDRQFRPVQIVGVTYPNNNGVFLIVTGVRQDEPVKDATIPDAMLLEGPRVALRAERFRPGGRTYYVTFTAIGGRFITCSGRVTVCVPNGSSCDGGGPLYNSLRP